MNFSKMKPLKVIALIIPFAPRETFWLLVYSLGTLFLLGDTLSTLLPIGITLKAVVK